MTKAEQYELRQRKAHELSGMRAWQIVEEEINQRIEIATRRLTTGSFKTLEDLIEVNRLQGEIQTLSKIISFVNHKKEN